MALSTLSGGTNIRPFCAYTEPVSAFPPNRCPSAKKLIFSGIWQNNFVVRTSIILLSYLCAFYTKVADFGTFSSSIIKDVIRLCESEAKALSGYAYFFFDSRNADKVLVMFENLLRSLLSQLSHRCGGIPAVLKNIYHAHCDGRTQPSVESLQETLRCVMEGFDHVYIMIDSLDECGDRAELLRWIQSLESWNSDRLHLLLTSRPEQDIRRRLDPMSRISQVMIDGWSQGDILLYLDEQLLSIAWDEKTRALVKNTLGKRSDAMCVPCDSLHMRCIHKCY